MNYIPDITQRFPEGFGGPFMSEEEISWQEKLQENKKKLNKASQDGNLVYFADSCVGCPHYECISCTYQNEWDVDDVEHGICHCLENITCEYRISERKGRLLGAIQKSCIFSFIDNQHRNLCDEIDKMSLSELIEKEKEYGLA